MRPSMLYLLHRHGLTLSIPDAKTVYLAMTVLALALSVVFSSVSSIRS